jgi:CheY-like chemotaxis protein
LTEELLKRRDQLASYKHKLKFLLCDERFVTFNSADSTYGEYVTRGLFTGLGIPESKQGLIFEAYEQIEGLTLQKGGGTGLGLPIVKQLLESLGSAIEVDSKLGRGSTFSFSLALQEVKAEHKPVDKGTEELNKLEYERIVKTLVGSHILFAEDNAINAMIFRDFLHKWQVTYDWAKDGDEVVRFATTANYDMILMDIQMPIIDGIRATKIIRAMNGNWFKEVPIIAFSAFALQETANEAFDAGMNDYLLKPFTPTQVVEKCYQYMIPFRKQRLNSSKSQMPSTGFYVQPEELPNSLPNMDFTVLDQKVIRTSMTEMLGLLEEALLTNDTKQMQRLCHKFIPSLKMLSVSDVWLDLAISRQVVEAGNLTPELSQKYIQIVKSKVEKYLDSLSQASYTNDLVSG